MASIYASLSQAEIDKLNFTRSVTNKPCSSIIRGLIWAAIQEQLINPYYWRDIRHPTGYKPTYTSVRVETPSRIVRLFDELCDRRQVRRSTAIRQLIWSYPQEWAILPVIEYPELWHRASVEAACLSTS